jgi:O-succinylbenzoate synthase
MRIESITLREISLTLKEPFQISSGATSQRRILLVELEDADGVVAWGECTAGEIPNYGPETIDTAWHAIREWVAPRVLGQEF